MPEIQRTQVREREPSASDTYDRMVKILLEMRDRGFKGKVIIRDEDVPWEQSRQGRLKHFITREVDTGTALIDWHIIMQDIRTHSGKHRHQGGLVIYVLEGEGYSEVEDETIEWEAGDLLLLPYAPGGLVHKHYNKRPGERCKWLAFAYRPYNDAVGHYLEQKENSPDYR